MGHLTLIDGRLQAVTDPSSASNDGSLQLGSWHFLAPPAYDDPNSGMYWGITHGWVDSSGNYSEAMGIAWNNCMGGLYGNWREIGEYPTHFWWPICDIALDSGTGWGGYQMYCWFMRCCFMKYYVPSAVRNGTIKKVKLWWFSGSGGARVRYTTASVADFVGPVYNSNMVVRAKLTSAEPATVPSITTEYHSSIAVDDITASAIIAPQSDYDPYWQVNGTDGTAAYPELLRSNRFSTLDAATHSLFSNSSVFLSWHFAYLANASCPAVNATYPHAVDVYSVQPPAIAVLIDA